jgi:3-oxoacyl-[acyl-carrier protein] reductase
MPTDDIRPPIALITGVGRKAGIAATIARGLSDDGWTVATAGWRPYDERMAWGADDRRLSQYETDLESPDGPEALIAEVVREEGPITALVMCHCESVDSGISTTTVESFDRHMAVNARSTWLLIRHFAEHFPADAAGGGRIVALTSDGTVGNLAYGASKAAMDRIVIAAATELAELNVTANVINPGATETGWMSPETQSAVLAANLQPRLGRPEDCTNLVRWLCSPQGQWINGQVLHSNGGTRR